MLMQRRDILKLILSSAALTAGWGITSASAATTKAPATPLPKEIKTKSLITLSIYANRFPEAIFGKSKVANAYGMKHCSVLTELDLKTEKVKHSIVPVELAHGATRLKNGNLIITGHHHETGALVDENHEVIEAFTAPEGYVFGGHSALFPEKNIAIVPMRHANPQTNKDTGRLLIYDASNAQLIDSYDSGGIHPHEIRLLSERDEFVITHYGDIHLPDPGGLRFNILEPKLSVLNSNDFSTKREYIQPIDAIFTHMDVGQDFNIYAVSNQYVPYKNKTRHNLKKILKKYDFEHKRPLPLLSGAKNKMAIPLGLARINAVTGDREVFLTSKEDFLRSQSVAAHPKSGRIFATYAYSNNLIVIDEATKKVTIKSAYDYGFNSIRGVTNIPGTDYVAISEQERGITIINAITLEAIKEFPVDIIGSAHIFAT